MLEDWLLLSDLKPTDWLTDRRTHDQRKMFAFLLVWREMTWWSSFHISLSRLSLSWHFFCHSSSSPSQSQSHSEKRTSRLLLQNVATIIVRWSVYFGQIVKFSIFIPSPSPPPYFWAGWFPSHQTNFWHSWKNEGNGSEWKKRWHD